MIERERGGPLFEVVMEGGEKGVVEGEVREGKDEGFWTQEIHGGSGFLSSQIANLKLFDDRTIR